MAAGSVVAAGDAGHRPHAGIEGGEAEGVATAEAHPAHPQPIGDLAGWAATTPRQSPQVGQLAGPVPGAGGGSPPLSPKCRWSKASVTKPASASRSA